MADLTITAANVVPGSGATKVNGTAGTTITAGQVVYLDSTTSEYLLADADGSGTTSPDGIALNNASDGQPLAIISRGLLTIGATVTAGTAYYLSATAGGIAPFADLTTGDVVTYLGSATSASVLDVKLHETGVTL